MEKLVFGFIKLFFMLAIAGQLSNYSSMRGKAAKSVQRGLINMSAVNQQLVGESQWLSP